MFCAYGTLFGPAFPFFAPRLQECSSHFAENPYFLRLCCDLFCIFVIFYNIGPQRVRKERPGDFPRAVGQTTGPKFCPKCDPVGTALDIFAPRCTPQWSEKWFALKARFSVNFTAKNYPNTTPLNLQNMVFA